MLLPNGRLPGSRILGPIPGESDIKNNLAPVHPIVNLKWLVFTGTFSLPQVVGNKQSIIECAILVSEAYPCRVSPATTQFSSAIGLLNFSANR